MIHEESYPQRSAKYEEVEMDGIKVDYYDTLHKVIHEIKKSDKVEVAHEWQLKYYMYVFEQNGIEGISGILEYPVLRKRDTVLLSDIDRETIVEMINEIKIKTTNTVPIPITVFKTAFSIFSPVVYTGLIFVIVGRRKSEKDLLFI